jgi:hypothetical protein
MDGPPSLRPVFPLIPGTAGHLKKAERVIAVEGNATGSFADHQEETGFPHEDRILCTWASGSRRKFAEKLIEMLRWGREMDHRIYDLEGMSPVVPRMLGFPYHGSTEKALAGLNFPRREWSSFPG